MRFVLLRHTGEGADVQRAPQVRHGDAVLPAAVLKQAYGAFAIRMGGCRAVDVDPDWEATAIAVADVAILGEVRCTAWCYWCCPD